MRASWLGVAAIILAVAVYIRFHAPSHAEMASVRPPLNATEIVSPVVSPGSTQPSGTPTSGPPEPPESAIPSGSTLTTTPQPVLSPTTTGSSPTPQVQIMPAVATATVSVPTRETTSQDVGLLKNDIVPTYGFVNTLTGFSTYSYRDFQTWDDGPGIVFARSYNSPDTRETSLGPGWTHNYNIRITKASDGSGDLYLVGPQGRTDLHKRLPDGSYAPRPAVPITLIATDTGTYIATNTENGTKWTFGPDGMLETIVDPKGNETVLTYNAFHQLIGIRDPAGRGSLHLSYDPNTRRLIAISDWASPPRIIRFGYDQQGRLSTVTNREGQITRYAYRGNTIWLTSITDARNHVALSLTYDSEGRVIRDCTAATLITGRCSTFQYVTNPDGSKVEMQHEAPISFAPGFSPIVVDTYDTHERIVREATIYSPNDQSLVDTYTYNSDDTRKSLVETGRATKPSAKGLVPVSDGSKLADPGTFNLAEETQSTMGNALALAANVRRDSFGRVVSFVLSKETAATAGLQAGRWLIQYDREDRPTRIDVMDRPDGVPGKSLLMSLSYDAVGNLIEARDALGHATTYTYNETDSLSGVSTSSGQTVRVQYDAHDNPVSVDFYDPKAGGHQLLTYAYDGLRRVRRIEQFPEWPSQTGHRAFEVDYDENGTATAYALPGK